MALLMAAVYVPNFAGLLNRLEALTIAFAIRARGGHRILLAWPELDVPRVASAARAGGSPRSTPRRRFLRRRERAQFVFLAGRRRKCLEDHVSRCRARSPLS